MNTQGTIWIDGSSIGNLEKIRYIDLASIRCGFRKAEAIAKQTGPYRQRVLRRSIQIKA